MCIFSRPVHVSGTMIFARATDHGKQYLAYQMTVKTKEPVAMILPIPVPPRSDENAVSFIDLQKMPFFFDYVELVCPSLPNKMDAISAGYEPLSTSGPPLRVESVGSFVASFVPTVADFSRLDGQFRLPDHVWKSLPQYHDFGFVVFQLKRGEKRIHPMAFEFPRRQPDKLFFPTVHIHDGEVHEQAHFDHALFCQRFNREQVIGWRESAHPLEAVSYSPDYLLEMRDPGAISKPRSVKSGLAVCQMSGGLLDPAHHLYRRDLRGNLSNQDVLI